VRTIRLIERTAWELIEDGLSLEGFYVGRHVPNDDARIAPRCPLLGRVESRQGSRLRLTDSRDGISKLLRHVKCGPNRAYSRLASHMCSRRVRRRWLNCSNATKRLLRQGPNRLDRIKRTISYWGHQHHEMAPGMPFYLRCPYRQRQRLVSEPEIRAGAKLCF